MMKVAPVALLIALIGCSAPGTVGELPTEVIGPESSFIRKEGASRVVVFVHGVLGDARGTWTSQNGAFFPTLIAEDPSLAALDVFVYDYPSPLYATTYTIDELGDNLRLVLDDAGIYESYKEVLFVCHSMGGLVVRAHLLKYQPRAQTIPMIYFFSTPSTGAEISNLAKSVLPRNPQFKDMRIWRDNAYVGNLVRQWLAAEFPIDSYCAYEKKKTYGVRVVDERSATNLCNKRLDPIDENHITIVKPPSRAHVSYLALRQALLATQATSEEASPLEALVTMDGGTYALMELLEILGEGTSSTILLASDLEPSLRTSTINVRALRGVPLRLALDRIMDTLNIRADYRTEGAVIFIERARA